MRNLRSETLGNDRIPPANELSSGENNRKYFTQTSHYTADHERDWDVII